MAAPDTLMAGRYRLVHRIAAGGMGWVWEAWDELLHRKVAVKQLLPQPGAADEDAQLARDRLIREARITARLHHPHVVTLYDVVEHDGCPCLIMQYVPSQSLNSLLRERGSLSEAAAVRIAADVAAGLAAAHEVGIVHRDVKPGNVLITKDGSAKLTDFGISHAAGDATLTVTGMVVGTPAYLAPEVARGSQSGFPADVFSFGATVYAALEGGPPFGNDDNPMATLHRVASGRIIPPRRSGGLTPLLLQMMAAQPGHRPAMDAVARALAARQAELAAVPEVLRGLTAASAPGAAREWPADPATEELSTWQAMLGSTPPERVEPAERRKPAELTELAEPIEPVGPAEVTGAPMPKPAAPPKKRGAHAMPADPSRMRRWIWPAAAVVVALAVVGAIILWGPPSRSDSTAGGNSAASLADDGPAVVTPAPVTPASVTPASATPAPVTPSRSTSPEVADSSGVSSGESSPTAAGLSVDTPSPSAAPPVPTTSETPSADPTTARDDASGEPTTAELAGFVDDYFASLPGDTERGWARLTPAFQEGLARNREYYERFWGGVDDVSVTDISATPPDRVEATVTYSFDDGREAVERTVYYVVRDADGFKINASEVLSSQSS